MKSHALDGEGGQETNGKTILKKISELWVSLTRASGHCNNARRKAKRSGVFNLSLLQCEIVGILS